MSGQVTLEMIYEAVKRLGECLRLIEDVIAEVLERSLPEAELSEGKSRISSVLLGK